MGYDAIVTETSTAAIAHAILKSTGKGKVTHVAPPKHDEVKSSAPSGVDVELTLVASAYKPEEDEACKFLYIFLEYYSSCSLFLI